MSTLNLNKKSIWNLARLACAGWLLMGVAQSATAYADVQTYVTGVETVIPGVGRGAVKKLILKTSEGSVYSYSTQEPDYVDVALTLFRAKDKDTHIRITYDQDALKSVELTASPMTAGASPATRPSDYVGYEPSNYSSEEEAQALMDSIAKIDVRGASECYWRAHYWSYSLWKNYDVKSKKVFIFFSSKYRSLSKKHIWGFHVAPTVNVNGQERVLDPVFNPSYKTASGESSNRILNISDWSKQFVDTKRECKYVDSYEEFKKRDASGENEHCYLMTVPMFYWNVLNLDSGSDNRLFDTWDAGQLKSSCKAVSLFGYCKGFSDEADKLIESFKKHHSLD